MSPPTFYYFSTELSAGMEGKGRDRTPVVDYSKTHTYEMLGIASNLH